MYGTVTVDCCCTAHLCKGFHEILGGTSFGSHFYKYQSS